MSKSLKISRGELSVANGWSWRDGLVGRVLWIGWLGCVVSPLCLSLFLVSFLYHSFLQEQVKLRDNALQQAQQWLVYKRVLCQADGLFQVLVSLLAEPLAKARRTEEEHLSIEIVLHLLRRFLSDVHGGRAVRRR